MKSIPFFVCFLFIVVLSGCAHTSYNDIMAQERKTHPPVVSNPDAQCWENDIDIIISSVPEQTTPEPVITPEPPRPEPVKNSESEWDVSITNKWTHIIIHHSATKNGNAAQFDRIHRLRGWDRGLGYHFVIGNGSGSPDGKIEVGPRWKNQIRGAHAGVAYYNQHGIGICLVGNFEETKPDRAQIDALVKLIRWLQIKCDIPAKNVLGHGDIKSTLCPGKNFPMNEVKRRILN